MKLASAFPCLIHDFPGGLEGRESICNSGDAGWIPGLGRFPGEGNSYPSVFLPGESQGHRSLAGYSPWSHKELDITQWLSMHVTCFGSIIISNHDTETWKVHACLFCMSSLLSLVVTILSPVWDQIWAYGRECEGHVQENWSHPRSATPSQPASRHKIKESRSLWVSESCSVVSNSLRPHGLYSPWSSLGQNTGVGSLSLLQGILPTKGSNRGLPHCRRILFQLSRNGSPRSL